MKYIIILILSVLVNPFINAQSFYKQLADSAYTLTKDHIEYDPSYFSIPFPNGDIPKGKGVCTDVIIRAYRKLGIDLQKEVHEDMKLNFHLYPKHWNLQRTDKNIDHRRVPNLMTFFERKGNKLPYNNFEPGDIVCWNLGGSTTHIGIVSNIKSNDEKQFKIIHNIGGGQVLENCLHLYTIIGHYRYK